MGLFTPLAASLQSANQAVNKWHSAENKKEMAGKIAQWTGTQNAVAHAEQRDVILSAGIDHKQASYDKLQERLCLRLDPPTHKALRAASVETAGEVLKNYSAKQIGKYFNRAVGHRDAAKTLFTAREQGRGFEALDDMVDAMMDTLGARGNASDERASRTVGAKRSQQRYSLIGSAGNSEVLRGTPGASYDTAKKLGVSFLNALEETETRTKTKTTFIERIRRDRENAACRNRKGVMIGASSVQRTLAMTPKHAVNAAGAAVVYAPAAVTAGGVAGGLAAMTLGAAPAAIFAGVAIYGASTGGLAGLASLSVKPKEVDLSTQPEQKGANGSTVQLLGGSDSDSYSDASSLASISSDDLLEGASSPESLGW